MTAWLNRIFNKSCEEMCEIPDAQIHCVVTSPPYFALRDYGVEGQIGLEDTLDGYLERMMLVFREAWRVLRDDGIVWLNMGDSYATRPRGTDNGWDKSRLTNPARVQKAQSLALRRGKMAASEGVKEKDQMLVPHRLVLALQRDGWYIRDTVCWVKSNPMPSSVTDRCTPAFEYVFMLTKRPRYFADMDAVREPLKHPDAAGIPIGGIKVAGGDNATYSGREYNATDLAGANMRNVWEIATQPFPEAHFATFPMELPMGCIKIATSDAGCCAECGSARRRVTDVQYENPGNRTTNGPRSTENREFTAGFEQRLEKRTTTRGFEPSCDCDATSVPCRVLDPFMGSGTTMAAAFELQRDVVGYELNPEYIALAERRPQIRERHVYAAAMRGESIPEIPALGAKVENSPLFGGGDEGEGAA